MKKILTGIAAIMLCTEGLVSAAEYNADDNTVTAATDGYKTLIITKDGEEGDGGIVYADQTTGTSFGASMTFFIKESPTDGQYTITLGGAASGTPSTESFYIGEVAPGEETISRPDAFFVEKSETEGCKNIAFTWEGIDGSKAKTIVLEKGGKGFGYKLGTQFYPGSSMDLGVLIRDIPDDEEDVSIYLSSSTIDELKNSKN